jgi:hypothetical protein
MHLSHPELIWERIKGALGVPPELMMKAVVLKVIAICSDWDAVMDSPIYARNPKRLSAGSPAASIYLTRREKQGAQFRSQVHDKLQGPAHTQWKVEKFDIGDFIPPFGY